MLNFMIIDIFYLPQILFSNHGHHFIYNLYQAAVLRIMSNTDFNLILLRRLNGKQLTNEMFNLAMNNYLVIFKILIISKLNSPWRLLRSKMTLISLR